MRGVLFNSEEWLDILVAQLRILLPSRHGSSQTVLAKLNDMQIRELFGNRNVRAWLLLVAAVALHVLDEALTGFLPFYNSSVASLRDRLGFFPAPTFSFGLWLGGLVAAIVLALPLTVFVARGGKTMHWVATILGVLMIFNALLHLSGSLYFGRTIPGTYSSPLLLLTAVYMVLRGLQGDWHFKKVWPEGTTRRGSDEEHNP